MLVQASRPGWGNKARTHPTPKFQTGCQFAEGVETGGLLEATCSPAPKESKKLIQLTMENLREAANCPGGRASQTIGTPLVPLVSSLKTTH